MAQPLGPGAAANWHDLGTVLLRADRHPEAIECFRGPARLSLSNFIIRDNLATADAAAGRLDEAIEQIHVAIRSLPETAGGR